MQLYKLTNTDAGTAFVRLSPTSMAAQGLKERDMEEWLVLNTHAILKNEERVLVIEQENPFDNKTDILAVDQDGNTVVIELKRGEAARQVLAQAIEYASSVAGLDYSTLNQRALRYFERRGVTEHHSLLDAFHAFFNLEQGAFSEEQFNRRQRLVIVGESIEDKIRSAARWLNQQGVVVNCLSYTCYITADGERFVSFENAVHQDDTISGPKTSEPLTPQQRQWLAYWSDFKWYLQQHESNLAVRKARTDNWVSIRGGHGEAYGYGLTAVNDPYTQVIAIFPGKDGRKLYESLQNRQANIAQRLQYPLEWRDKSRWIKDAHIFLQLPDIADLSDEKKWGRYHEWLHSNLEALDKVLKETMDLMSG